MNLSKKEWVLVVCSWVLVILVINIATLFIVKKQLGVFPFGAEYREKKAHLRIPVSPVQWPHPYFGLTTAGQATLPENQLTNEPLFNQISPRSGNKEIKVLVLGGSVAAVLSKAWTDKEIIEEQLLSKKLNRYFSTDRFTVYNAAFGGGKQPQQYFKFMYLDLLGFRPDIVINYDGFNEIALCIAENETLGIPAIFPRSYSDLLSISTKDRSCAKISNYLLDLDSSIPLVEFITIKYEGHCRKKLTSTGSISSTLGSNMGVNENTDYASQSVAIWRESSNRLYEMLKMRNIAYIHVLQPNQYLEGSKVFTDEEKALFGDYPRYAAAIREHYPKMNQNGLYAEHFRDQRFLFRDVRETVYADACCHFNERGMEAIVDDIVTSQREVFLEALSKGD
jgi:hypothetical protein